MILEEIAEWAVSSGRKGSAEARHAARRLLMDQIGIAHAGAGRLGVHPTTRLALRYRSHPRATLWVQGDISAAPYAALANRAAGDELELAAGPECVAAAFAAGEIADATLGDVLDAIAIAADVEEYFRGYLMLPLEGHGLHPPAALGALAACAAAGRVLGFASRQLAGAMSAAGCLTPPSPYAAFSSGASGKTLYGAWSQMLGLSAALWSRVGIVGPTGAIEGSRGLAQALLHADGAVTPPRFVQDGAAITRVTFKAFPCNRACHAPLSALAKLQDVDPGEIERVEVRTYRYAVDLDRRSRGTSRIAAQMSIRTTLALAMLQRELLPGPGADQPTRDAAVDSLASLISVSTDPQEIPTTSRIRKARIVVHLRTGKRLEAEALARWALHEPATDGELRTRFLGFTAATPAIDPWDWPEDQSVRRLIARARHG